MHRRRQRQAPSCVRTGCPATALSPWDSKIKAFRLFAAAALSLAASSCFADAVVLSLDLASGRSGFGRSDATGAFTDTYTFSLIGQYNLISASASNVSWGLHDMDFTSLDIRDESGAVVASFGANTGSRSNQVYTLDPLNLGAGNYSLVVSGINSPSQVAYRGTLVVEPGAVVPEPGSLALVLAGLAAAGLVSRRKTAL